MRHIFIAIFALFPTGRIEDGKVAEYWLTSDQLDLMTQLGMRR